jgi:hypothetical protein
MKQQTREKQLARRTHGICGDKWAAERAVVLARSGAASLAPTKARMDLDLLDLDISTGPGNNFSVVLRIAMLSRCRDGPALVPVLWVVIW